MKTSSPGLQLALAQQHSVLLNWRHGLLVRQPRQGVGCWATGCRRPALLGLLVPLPRCSRRRRTPLGLFALQLSFTTFASAFSSVAPGAFSAVLSLSEHSSTASATIVFRTVSGIAGLLLEPSARNSSLLPVNANGLRRSRSASCSGSAGSNGVPRPSSEPGFELLALPASISPPRSFSSSRAEGESPR